MNQGTQGYSLMKKTEGRKSRDTVPLTDDYIFLNSLEQRVFETYIQNDRGFLFIGLQSLYEHCRIC
jgi:hypothetical protein